jgi:hypothetical protein
MIESKCPKKNIQKKVNEYEALLRKKIEIAEKILPASSSGMRSVPLLYPLLELARVRGGEKGNELCVRALRLFLGIDSGRPFSSNDAEAISVFVKRYVSSVAFSAGFPKSIRCLSPENKHQYVEGYDPNEPASAVEIAANVSVHEAVISALLEHARNTTVTANVAHKLFPALDAVVGDIRNYLTGESKKILTNGKNADVALCDSGFALVDGLYAMGELYKQIGDAFKDAATYPVNNQEWLNPNYANDMERWTKSMHEKSGACDAAGVNLTMEVGKMVKTASYNGGKKLNATARTGTKCANLGKILCIENTGIGICKRALEKCPNGDMDGKREELDNLLFDIILEMRCDTNRAVEMCRKGKISKKQIRKHFGANNLEGLEERAEKTDEGAVENFLKLKKYSDLFKGGKRN